MIENTSRAVRLCGTEEVDPPSRRLRAGALSVELENGALRYVRLGGVEVLRAIAFLVRDENWGTFTPKIDDLKIDERQDRFTVTYRGTCADAKRRLSYDATIEGKSDGSLAFVVVAEPVTDVLTNRTGFVVLHAVEGVAGEPVTVRHVDGSEKKSTFPELISPGQPFLNIRALTHEVMPGVFATCTMESVDGFEMEDQRNWTDASYKTYVRSLLKPWPYMHKKGEKFEQSVRLTFSGRLPAAAASASAGPVRVELGGDAGAKMPAIGVGVPAEEAEHALTAVSLVKKLGPKHLVCAIDLRGSTWRKALSTYRRLGEETGAEVVLEVVIPGGMDPAAELEPVAKAVGAAKLSPAAVAVFPEPLLHSYQPSGPWPELSAEEAIAKAARRAFPRARLGGGMYAYFTELNRKRPAAGLYDYVTHTTCPIVHAADDRSVMESLEALRTVALSTRAMIGNAAYRVGPSAIGCRDNPYGKAPFENPGNGRVPLAKVDPRQRGLLNAAWTLGYVAAFARGRVEAIALGAPTGPFGYIHRGAEYAQPYYDDLQAPAVYPAFHVVAGLATASGKALRVAKPSRPGIVDAIAYGAGAETTLWIANVTAAKQTVELATRPRAKGTIAVLDDEAFARMTTEPDYLAEGNPYGGEPIVLGPYAVCRIEFSP
jgi:D-apionolactonase